MYSRFLAGLLTFLIFCCESPTQEKVQEPTLPEKPKYDYSQPYRPQFHFSPIDKWMNDPNGMVYYEGEYHLFYQYYPDSTVWGPMHWGHAISTDLVNWEHLPIALYPDSLGLIFSGSAVVDWTNSTGFGDGETPPMVAIFTYHLMEGEKSGADDFQYQGIAYSLDKGRTWEKYQGNPVLPNEGIRDFRDPKVFWHDATGKWVMVLAEGDEVGLYGSSDMKSWELLSRFGIDQGSHTGVWECPDLFPLKDVGGNERWVLLVSIGTGGDMGSDTQYFIGNFDGTTFTNDNPSDHIMWLDHGKDNYAGVTWSDVDESDGRRIFMGWMSNWQYAQVVPTEIWRSNMTLPRELGVYRTRDGYRLANRPVEEVGFLREEGKTINRVVIAGKEDWETRLPENNGLLNFEIMVSDISGRGKSWKLTFSNSVSEELILGYDQDSNQYFVDRQKAGVNDFSEDFAGIHYAKRISEAPQMPLSIWMDASSVELFADNGTVAMTDLFFMSEQWNRVVFESGPEAVLVEGDIYRLQSIWE